MSGDGSGAAGSRSKGALALPGLSGARALVTGGSRGIGRATAVMLARAGARVGVAYHSDHAAAEETIRKVREASGAGAEEGDAPRAWAHAGDLSGREEVASLFEEVDRKFGGLDVFVGNAGIWNPEPLPLERLSPEQWEEMMAVNLTSIYLTARAAVRRMEEGGRVVLVSSTAGQRGEPDHSHYAASKGGIISFAKSLAGELGPRGITVNAVAPGWVDTDMSAPALEGSDLDEILAEIPLGRVAAAGDVAGPVCFLASDLGRHVTGEVVNVNGGSVLCG